MEGSRQALIENKRKHPIIDVEHYKATGEIRYAPLLPAEDTSKEG